MALSAYLPAFVYEIGNGAIAPINAATAVSCGASTTVAAFILTLPVIGLVLGDLPSSALAERLGDRRAMIFAAFGTMVGLLGCMVAHSLFVLAPALLLIGMCNSTYYLGRQAYMTEVIPPHLRARAMSTLGGSHRVGLFVGPFVGAGVIALTELRAAYVVAIVTSAIAALLLWVIPEADRVSHLDRPTGPNNTLLGLLSTRHRMFLTVGSAAFAFSALRAVRQIVLPLWAVHIGLDATQTSIVFGIASSVDMVLFYPSGKVMDHFGRLAIALPSLLILGVSMMVLPLTHSALALTIDGCAMSLGNGIGSGVLMTTGADLAPPDARVKFLSLFRVWTDTGSATGPIVLSVIGSVLTLGTGVVVIGTLGFFAAAAFGKWLPEFTPFATPAATRAHRERGATARLVEASPVQPAETPPADLAEVPPALVEAPPAE